MSEYRIEKLRQHVAVVLADGQRLEGDIFVLARVRFRPGPEDPIDLFNDHEAYFALSRPADVLLMAKDQVARVECSAPAADNPFEAPHLGVNVAITLSDGSVATGYLFPETRAERPRLIDFLNAYTLRFLAVFAADHVCLVNRRLIAHVRELT